MQLYCLTYKGGNTNQRVVVQAPNPHEAQILASELLEESGKSDWKFTSNVESIRGFIAPQTESTTIQLERTATA